jgi:hypothetical protein
VGVAALLVVASLAWRRLKGSLDRHRRKQGRPGPKVRRDPEARPEAEFRARASRLGIQGRELQKLTRIALRLAPQAPSSLLATRAGREYLIAILRRRATRRKREIAVLKNIRRRLRQLGGHDLHKRHTRRVETGVAA